MRFGWGNLLFTVTALALLMQAGAMASPRPYVHPDYVFSHQLKQRYRAPGTVNVNRANLEELKTLPGMDESTALKLMRLRKSVQIKTLDDLYRLPMVDRREIDVLVDLLRNRVAF